MGIRNEICFLDLFSSAKTLVKVGFVFSVLTHCGFSATLLSTPLKQNYYVRLEECGL